MILNKLEDIKRIIGIHPGFDKAAEFLNNNDLPELEKGRYEIDGDNVYALVQEYQSKGTEQARLEAHQRYIDIQFCISGDEVIGYKNTEECNLAPEGYNSEKDIAFYTDKPDFWLPVAADNFAVFFPEDAHAPMAGTGTIRKIVLKIKA